MVETRGTHQNPHPYVRFSDQCTGYLRHENRDDVIHLLFQFYYVDKLFTHKDLASEHLVGPGNGEKSKLKIGFFFRAMRVAE